MTAFGGAGRPALRHLGRAAALAWRAAPAALLVRLLLTVTAAANPVAAAWLTKLVLDRLTATGPVSMAAVAAPVALLVLTGVLAAVLPEVLRYVEAEAGRAVTLRGRRGLYDALGRTAGLARFENPRFHDGLRLAAGSGPEGSAQIVSCAIGTGQGLITLAGFLVTLTVLSPSIVVVVLLAAVPALRSELLLSRHRADLMWELSRSGRREAFYTQLLTNVTAAKEIRLFGLSRLFAARMVDELRGINRSQRRIDRRELRTQGLHAALGAVVAGAALVWAVAAARAGRLTVGDVSVVVAATAGVQGALRMLIQNLGQIHQALLLFGHYVALIDAGPDLPVAARPRPVPPLRQGIELRDVWFRYSDTLPWVLRGVSVTLRAGESTALVGLNGAGKSTLVKLLCRFYDPVRGAIHWDGIDLRELPVDEVRERIGAVFQDFMTYELTAADNVGIGDVCALDDRGRVEAAAAAAGCHDQLASMPHGYDTMLTRIFDHDDAGVVLSGGQWQRVALARALMRRDRDLLILDEPSSGLDAEAEHEIHVRLRGHRAGRTGLLISHRLSAVRDADTIVVLAGGEVAEQGTHAELMRAGGAYARLFSLQARGFQDRKTRLSA